MKADANHDWDDGEAAELRAALRGWTVPPPPTEIEDALRREFRRRRPRRPSAVWLSLAAAVVVVTLAAWPLVSSRLGGRPSVARFPSQPLGPSAPDERREAPIGTTARRESRCSGAERSEAGAGGRRRARPGRVAGRVRSQGVGESGSGAGRFAPEDAGGGSAGVPRGMGRDG